TRARDVRGHESPHWWPSRSPRLWSPWQSVAQAAEYANIAESTLRKLIRAGRVPVAKPGGKLRSLMLIARADLESAAVAEHCRWGWAALRTITYLYSSLQIAESFLKFHEAIKQASRGRATGKVDVGTPFVDGLLRTCVSVSQMMTFDPGRSNLGSKH
ncbi:MAG TPA: helix-turn-helix domain-containing protein, partial [Jiangellaceae bacterium]|nr:helix-turn-helix domain-containing protein [Jiangellaceae bacterium]